MSFASNVLLPDIGVRFVLQIQGIGDLLCDGPAPVDPEGDTWLAPQSKGYSYTWRPFGLDTADGIQAIGQTWDRRSGDTTPATLPLMLSDDQSGWLRNLLAQEWSGGLEAYLASSVAYDTTGAGTNLVCDDLTGWPSSGHAYVGRETVAYVVSGSTLQCRAAVGGVRDLFSVGDCDLSYVRNEARPGLPRLVTTWPTVWHGRYVQLWAYLTDAEGRALDTAWGGANMREIWRGIIDGDPVPDQDWHRWRVQTRSIDAILHTEVGPESLKGSLLLPERRIETGEGAGAYEFSGIPGQWAALITDEVRILHVSVTEWPTPADFAADTNSSTTNYQLDVWGAGTVKLVTRDEIITAWNACVNAGASSPMGDYNISKLRLRYKNDSWRVEGIASGTYVQRVSFRCGAVGSIMRLFGWPESDVVLLLDPADDNRAPYDGLAVWVSAESKSIPIALSRTEAVSTEVPSAPGYVRIGEDETAEMVRYSTITASDDVPGLYVLGGCARGRMGTQPQPHQVVAGPDAAAAESAEVVFGVGWERTSFVDVLLQLAHSTGAGHHGAADVLGDVSVPLCPSHFDAAGWASLKAGLSPQESTVDYFLSEPVQWLELAGGWLGPSGYHVTARDTGAGYLVTVDADVPALETDPAREYGDADLDGADPAQIQDSGSAIVNELTVNYRWDVVAEEAVEGATATIRDRDSIHDHGTRGRVEWTLRGMALDAGSAIVQAAQWGASLFARHGHPTRLLTLRMSRAGWLLRPGDGVSVSLPGLPGPDGARGLVSRLAVVLAVSHRYHQPDGEVGSDVTVLLERQVRQSRYAPSGRVASYSATPPATLTLEDHAFSEAGDALDASHFDAGDKLLVYDEGNLGSAETVTVASVSGSVLTLSAPLASLTPTSATIVRSATYATATSTQRKHAYIASGAPPVLGATPTRAFRYV